MQSTKKSTRIIIWIIAIAMAGGFIGSSFLMIFNTSATTEDASQVDATTTPSGQPDPTAFKVEGRVAQISITDIKVGTGETAKVGDTINVHYKGTLAQSGIKFDSSYDRGEPIALQLQTPTATQSGVIEGWVIGIDGMKAGGKRRLVIPASMAYGDQAKQGIPADSDLVFEVELLGVAPPAPMSDL